MKKWMLGLVMIVAIAVIAVYVFIPTVIAVRSSVIFHGKIKPVFRTMSQKKNWRDWWPEKIETTTTAALMYRNQLYHVADVTTTDILVKITGDALNTNSSVAFIPVAEDSFRLQWQASIAASYNPWKRVQVYFAAANLQKDLTRLLNTVKNYYNNEQRIYGLKIKQESVKDTALVFIADSAVGYPATDKVYSLIAELRYFLSRHNAVATDSPMLNVYTPDNVHYITKVAIPTNKILPSSGKIHYRWMLPRGNILVAEVKGDAAKTQQAFKIVDDYVHDHEMTAPAIPFFKLLTNRQQEKDSTKWVTKIYYPVMFF